MSFMTHVIRMQLPLPNHSCLSSLRTQCQTNQSPEHSAASNANLKSTKFSRQT